MVLSNTNVFYWHDYHNLLEVTEDNAEELKRAFLPEIASQFRNGQMISGISFPGHGIYLQTGFISDMSENCAWMTPYVLEPSGDPWYLVNGIPGCKMGANNGLQLLLDAETYDYASSPTADSEGFMISLLHYLVRRLYVTFLIDTLRIFL